MTTLHVTYLKTFREKTLGLIPAQIPYPVMIKTRFGIHTLFMKFPIDVLVLDKESRVVKLKENLKPNYMFLWNPKYDTVLELPAGTIKNKTIKIGETIKVVLEMQ